MWGLCLVACFILRASCSFAESPVALDSSVAAGTPLATPINKTALAFAPYVFRNHSGLRVAFVPRVESGALRGRGEVIGQAITANPNEGMRFIVLFVAVSGCYCFVCTL